MRIERFVSKGSEVQGSGLVNVKKGKATLNLHERKKDNPASGP